MLPGWLGTAPEISPPSGKGSSSVFWHLESYCVLANLKDQCTFWITIYCRCLKHLFKIIRLLTQKLLFLPHEVVMEDLFSHTTTARSLAHHFVMVLMLYTFCAARLRVWAKHPTFKSFMFLVQHPYCWRCLLWQLQLYCLSGIPPECYLFHLPQWGLSVTHTQLWCLALSA